jgi:hypothetical protein
MKITQALCVALGLTLVGCGQDPSFLNNESTAAKSSDQQVNTSGGSVDDNGQRIGKNGEGTDPQGNDIEGGENAGETGPNGEVILPGDGQNDWTPDWADGEETDQEDNNGTNSGTGTNPGTTNPDKPVIPGASEGDLDALHKCLAKWNGNPFTGTVRNYRKISASVSVGGFGNLINDNESTAQPFLTLVEAGVNVLGSPTYNLMNKNGYYCIKVNVNVSTNLNINLHCNARLADQKVNVNVGSTQNDSTSAVGVHVLSNVQINTVRPEGQACIR